MDALIYGLLTKEIKETIGASYVSSISSSDANNVYLDVTYKKDDASTETVRLTFPKPLNGSNGINGTNGVDGEDGLSIVSVSFVGNDMVFTRSDSSTMVIVEAKTLLTPNIESKQDLLVSGTNIKTVLGQTIVGSGNLDINADQINTTSTTNKFITQARITKLDGIETGAQVNTVNKVNEKTGDVVLTQNDVADTTNYIRMTPAERAKLGNLTDNFKGLYANAIARDLAVLNPQNGNYVIQEDTDSIWYYSTSWNDTGTTSTGDMNKAIYDPQNINGDSFSRANHSGTQLSSTISDFDARVNSNSNVFNSFKKTTDTMDSIQDGATYVKTTNDFTSAEKSKLAGIEPNATGDQSASEILALIKTVDGTGSGLDADLLGGQSLVTLQASIGAKQDTLVSGNNIKTINGNNILGSGDLVISGGGGGAVDSVNGQVGVVVLDTDDISDTTSTNKFTTQSDINKLATIESGAQVNNISNTNATALTNNGDTSIHFHSADRIRSNHTGTQPASTISDFNTAVASSPSVTENTAKVSFPEAPNDGSYYARRSQGWSPVLYTENTIFLENPTAPNVASGDNSTKVANTSFVKNNPTTAKAWVNFSGQGTPTVRTSHNVSSISDNGIGSYGINFYRPMADTNYSYVFGLRSDSDNDNFIYSAFVRYSDNKSLNALNFRTKYALHGAPFGFSDLPEINVQIFGN